MLEDKMLPYNLDAERILLAYTLINGTIDYKLDPNDLYLESHRIIHSAFRNLIQKNVTPDMITLIEELKTSEKLEEAGGAAYIASLTDGMPNFRDGQAGSYAEIVRQKSALRQLIRCTNETMARAYSDTETFAEITPDLLNAIDSVTVGLSQESGPVSMESAVSTAFKEIEAIASSRTSGLRSGLSLGYAEFDRLIPAGLKADDFMLMGGRPGEGKTSCLLGILSNMAREGKSVLFFSIEMGIMQIMMKLLCAEAEVALSKVLTGFVGREDWSRIGRAAAAMAQWKFWIDDSTGIQVTDIRSRYRRLRTTIDVIAVDYLQLMDVPKSLHSKPRYEQIGFVSRSMKAMCKDLKVPVIACAQLNRDVTKRKKSRPQLSDLRESGQLEQDADIIAFLHRPDQEESTGLAEVIIGKQRNGPTGDFQMAFVKEYAKFCNLYQQEQGNEQWYQR